MSRPQEIEHCSNQISKIEEKINHIQIIQVPNEIPFLSESLFQPKSKKNDNLYSTHFTFKDNKDSTSKLLEEPNSVTKDPLAAGNPLKNLRFSPLGAPKTQKLESPSLDKSKHIKQQEHGTNSYSLFRPTDGNILKIEPPNIDFSPEIPNYNQTCSNKENFSPNISQISSQNISKNPGLFSWKGNNSHLTNTRNDYQTIEDFNNLIEPLLQAKIVENIKEFKDNFYNNLRLTNTNIKTMSGDIEYIKDRMNFFSDHCVNSFTHINEYIKNKTTQDEVLNEIKKDTKELKNLLVNYNFDIFRTVQSENYQNLGSNGLMNGISDIKGTIQKSSFIELQQNQLNQLENNQHYQQDQSTTNNQNIVSTEDRRKKQVDYDSQGKIFEETTTQNEAYGNYTDDYGNGSNNTLLDMKSSKRARGQQQKSNLTKKSKYSESVVYDENTSRPISQKRKKWPTNISQFEIEENFDENQKFQQHQLNQINELAGGANHQREDMYPTTIKDKLSYSSSTKNNKWSSDSKPLIHEYRKNRSTSNKRPVKKNDKRPRQQLNDESHMINQSLENSSTKFNNNNDKDFESSGKLMISKYYSTKNQERRSQKSQNTSQIGQHQTEHHTHSNNKYNLNSNDDGTSRRTCVNLSTVLNKRLSKDFKNLDDGSLQAPSRKKLGNRIQVPSFKNKSIVAAEKDLANNSNSGGWPTTLNNRIAMYLNDNSQLSNYSGNNSIMHDYDRNDSNTIVNLNGRSKSHSRKKESENKSGIQNNGRIKSKRLRLLIGNGNSKQTCSTKFPKDCSDKKSLSKKKCKKSEKREMSILANKSRMSNSVLLSNKKSKHSKSMVSGTRLRSRSRSVATLLDENGRVNKKVLLKNFENPIFRSEVDDSEKSRVRDKRHYQNPTRNSCRKKDDVADSGLTGSKSRKTALYFNFCT